MEKSTITIRAARPEDAAALLVIYAPYVEKTAITIEYEVPSVEEFTQRITSTLARYPYLVAEADGQILGYAYVGTFHDRPAYDWSVETSIYVDSNLRHSGVGRALHDALERVLGAMGILNLNACIAWPNVENDPYLTRNSGDFHEHMGYRPVGTFSKCGYKFHRWYDMIWMEKHIGEHLENQPPIRLFPDVQKELGF